MKMYIAVLEDAPDYIIPTLVAHTVLGAHLAFEGEVIYQEWLKTSFRKCVVRVNQKEFSKISALPRVHLGHESTILNGEKSCAIPLPCHKEDLPNVLKFAKLWKPNVKE